MAEKAAVEKAAAQKAAAEKAVAEKAAEAEKKAVPQLRYARGCRRACDQPELTLVHGCAPACGWHRGRAQLHARFLDLCALGALGARRVLPSLKGRGLGGGLRGRIILT